MSDLQILTGLSILISGYIQLHYGITCWHWQQLVYLAWFSSVTHQACLTFLRPYLYQHPIERAWRLVLMGAVSIMLIGALIPTANYEWGQGLPNGLSNYSNDDYVRHYRDSYGRVQLKEWRPYPAEHALCYFGITEKADAMSITSVAISIAFIVVGYMSRIVRLHQILSVSLVGGARKSISKWLHKGLRVIYQGTGAEKSPNSLAVLFFYRPLLANFLLMRIILDLWTSMFFEVLWLLTSLVWGSIRFYGTRNMYPTQNTDWTFGQIIPVILLLAPIVTVIEAFYSDETYTDHNSSNTPLQSPPQRVSTAMEAQCMTAAPVEFDPKMSKDASWYQILVSLTMLVSVINVVAVLTLYSLSGRDWRGYLALKVTLPDFFVPSWHRAAIFDWLPLYISLYLILFILCSLLLEDIKASRDHTPLQNTVIFVATLITFIGVLYLATTKFIAPSRIMWSIEAQEHYMYALFASYGTYILLAISYRLFGCKGFCANVLDIVKPVSWLWDRARKAQTTRN